MTNLCATRRRTAGGLNSLQGIEEFAVVDGERVDHFLDQLAVTVGEGGGYVDEDLQVLHPVGQLQHLLRGADVKLHRVSERENRQRFDP